MLQRHCISPFPESSAYLTYDTYCLIATHVIVTPPLTVSPETLAALRSLVHCVSLAWDLSFLLLQAPPALIDMALRDTVVQWGKPSLPTLACTERRLNAQRAAAKGDSAAAEAAPAETAPGFWMVGDNPASDMAVAALGGKHWKGVLVETGVYVAGDARCGAFKVAKTVDDAVDVILAAHADAKAKVAAAAATD